MALEIRFLTPEEQCTIDPDGRGSAFLSRLKDTDPTPASRLVKGSRQDFLNWYLDRRTQWAASTHPALLAWDDACVAKYGPQGGSFDITIVKSIYRESYELATRGVTCRDLRYAVDYLRRRFSSAVRQYGFPQPVYHLTHGTSASLPTMLRKGDYIAETLEAYPYRHLKHMLCGERYQRLKKRVINQDPVLNVRLWEGELAAMRNWLKEHFPEYFSGWLDPARHLQVAMANVLARPFVSIEADYCSCDTHFSWDVARDVVLPILEPLFPSEVVFLEFAAYVEELFKQPLYFGTEEWIGLHNLFSGQSITNDFETYFDIVLQIAALLEVFRSTGDAYHLACGDDQSLILVNGKINGAQDVFQTIKALSGAAGLDLAESKCRISSTDIAFCRRLYHPSLRRYWNVDGQLYMPGFYPHVLIANSIKNPEKFCDINTALDVGVASLVQRLDNGYGSPWHTQMCQFVGSHYAQDKVQPAFVNAAQAAGWWEKVYGTTWSLYDSPSYKILCANHLIFT